MPMKLTTAPKPRHFAGVNSHSGSLAAGVPLFFAGTIIDSSPSPMIPPITKSMLSGFAIRSVNCAMPYDTATPATK